MDAIVIICLLAGVASVVASFALKDKTEIDNKDKEKIVEEIREKALSEESLSKVMSGIEKDFTSKLSGIAEEKLDGSSDNMSEIANDKMLAINEMSGQLLEKIEQNHKEVIFLYDMLNEKSDNLKDFSAKIDGLRKELDSKEEQIKNLNNELDDKFEKVKEVQERPVPVLTESSGLVSDTDFEMMASQAQNLVQMKMKEDEAAKVDLSALRTEVNLNIASVNNISSMKQDIKEQEVVSKTEEGLSVNDKIFAMKDEGMSIVEISKTLGMGQGEVQLILELFGK